MAIASTANYKTYAGISVSTFDAQLDVIIPAAQAYMERWCGRLFDTATFTEFHDGHQSDVILINNPPITSITSIKIYKTVDDTPTAMDSSSYTFTTDDSGIIRLQPTYHGLLTRDAFDQIGGPDFGIRPNFPRGFRNVQVVYVGAFSSQTMPADVKLVLYRIVDSLLEQAGRDATLNSEKLGSYEYYNGQIADVFKYHEGLLKPYRRHAL